ncbi:hypothetical protein CEE45_13225 [Candidatus Heimdallarchaeota archaeon B3_Heim]|nr:MAG: hypothetical protein CEE45_13225 [Candidatus Heimdallarchaeota archaeon B3_Heim]
MRRIICFPVIAILSIFFFQSLSCILMDIEPSLKNQQSLVILNYENPQEQFFEYVNHSSICIQGNYELELYASLENWEGDGSEQNPFVISGYEINGSKTDGSSTSQPLLYMNKTDYHCLVINNLFVDANGSIIHLETVTNIKIIDNTISNGNDNGIIVNNSHNIIISGNNISQNAGNGILHFFSNNSLITNNSIFWNKGNGTILIESQNVTTYNNSIFSNNGNGITPVSSKELIISKNSIYANNVSGIRLEKSDETLIHENIVHNTNNYEGIVLYSSENNSISENVVYNNSRIGIALFDSNKNEIVNNIVFNNNRFGILIEYSNNNTISYNVVYRTNYLDGIQLYFSENNNVSYNKVYENMNAGILLYSATKNLIANNTVYRNNGSGIIFHISTRNDIFNNVFYRNDIGMILWSFSNLNRIYNNVFYDPDRDEISLNSNVSDNNISQNDFHNSFNGGEISDHGERNIFSFNYISNWTSPDANANGIVDIPFSISGSAYNQDTSPRVSPLHHVLMPLILYSPMGKEIFSKEITIRWEPSFDTFRHDIAYSLYYSSDRGTSWNSISDQIMSNTYLWNISSLINGQNYMIKVVASCSEELNIETISNNPFTIMNHFLSPITLLYPKDGERLNRFVNIRWESVNDSLGHQITYAVYFSSNNGLHWILLAQELSSTSYGWDTSTLDDGSEYKIMILAQCAEGESIYFILEGNIIIQNTPENPIGIILLILFVLGIVIFGITSKGVRIYRANLDISAQYNLEDLRLGICVGSFSTDNWKIVDKNEICPFEKPRLLSMIEFSAVSYKHGEFGQIYGPFPQIMTPDSQERQWQVISFSFHLKSDSYPDSEKNLNVENHQVLLLIYYEKQFEILINSKRKSLQKYLISLQDDFVFSKNLLDEMKSRIVDLLIL